uniref:Uncharacterized protein n=1 Tax=Anopheles coluzzii TaxID=1518534 RepID=A0A8W7Q0K4_ANOCL
MSRSPYRNVLSGFVSKHTSSMRTTAPSSDFSTFSLNWPPRAWASILMCVYTVVCINTRCVTSQYSTYEMSRSPYRNVLSGFVSKHTSSMRYVFLLYRVSTTAPSSDFSTFSLNWPPRAWASILMCVYTVVCISTRCVTSQIIRRRAIRIGRIVIKVGGIDNALYLRQDRRRQ